MPENFINSENDLTLEGYETFYSEDSEHSHIFNEDEYQSPEGITKTGKAMSNSLVTAISGSAFKGMAFSNDNRVLGMPFKYSHLADPLSRVYQNSFESDSSCVAFIKFGVPNINRLLYQKMSVDADADKASVGVGTNIALGLRSGLSKDRRLISFEPDMKEFMKYATASLSQVYLLMDLPGAFSYEGWDEYNDTGVPFYCVKTTSVNEAVTNDYTTPDIVDAMNSDAAKKRQNYQLYGTYGSVNTGGSVVDWLKNIASGTVEKIKENLASSDTIIGTVASVFMSTNKGSMSYYGKIWADSKSENSYSLSFKFKTPYGNKYDIFRNVFFPFILLHTAGIPKQENRFSYQEPFMIQIDYPGWFTVQCGVITNLSWTRGGDAQLFSIDGLPLEIDVTMQVEDLYPIQLASKSITSIEYNYGLLTFLENLAGISVTQAEAMHVTGWQGELKQAVGDVNVPILGHAAALGKTLYRHMTGGF